MSTQKECVTMLYNVNTVITNIEQINIIIKRTALKIPAVHVIRQDIKYGPIIVKSEFIRKIRLEQAISLNHLCIRH